MSINRPPPILKIRQMMAYFRLNLASQTFIKKSVPSVKKLLNLVDKDEAVRETRNDLERLFEPYDLGLTFEVGLEIDKENPESYYLNIDIHYGDEQVFKESLNISNNKLVSNYNIHREELFLRGDY